MLSKEIMTGLEELRHCSPTNQENIQYIIVLIEVLSDKILDEKGIKIVGTQLYQIAASLRQVPIEDILRIASRKMHTHEIIEIINYLRKEGHIYQPQPHTIAII